MKLSQVAGRCKDIKETLLVFSFPADASVAHRASFRKKDILLFTISLPFFDKFIFKVRGATVIASIQNLGGIADLILMLLHNLVDPALLHQPRPSWQVRDEELGRP